MTSLMWTMTTMMAFSTEQINRSRAAGVILLSKDPDNPRRKF